MLYRLFPMAGDELRQPNECGVSRNNAIAAYMQLIDGF